MVRFKLKTLIIFLIYLQFEEVAEAFNFTWKDYESVLFDGSTALT